LESGKYGASFSTGMAAVLAIVCLFPAGSHIIALDDLYGGSRRLFEDVREKYGVRFSYVDLRDLKALEAEINENTKAIFLETPSNPTMKVIDIRAVSQIAKSRGLLTIVDNTFLSPYFQRPLELGADFVVHSGTKYLGGHNDTLSGFVVTNDEVYHEKIKWLQNAYGTGLAPFDCWLMLRGIKTLGVRLDKQESNAIKIAKWLKKHPKVEKVEYLGLPDNRSYELTKKQCSGFGAMISFWVSDAATAEQVLERLEIITFAESLGGVDSLITYPITQTHKCVPEEVREKLGINEKLLRLSVGIEGIDDLIGDLDQALEVKNEIFNVVAAQRQRNR